jgi:hypothetical protein
MRTMLRFDYQHHGYRVASTICNRSRSSEYPVGVMGIGSFFDA